MTSGYMPERMPDKDDLSFDQTLEAVRETLKGNPRLKEMPDEEVTRQLVMVGFVGPEFLPQPSELPT